MHQQEEVEISNTRKRNLSTHELEGITFEDAVKIHDRAGKTSCADNGESLNPTLGTTHEVECPIHSSINNSSFTNIVRPIALSKILPDVIENHNKTMENGQSSFHTTFGRTKSLESIKGISWNCRGC